MVSLSCFKAYDIRGKLDIELNEDIAYRIGRAYGKLFKPRNIILGGDPRLTSNSLKQAITYGLNDAGSDVLDIGMSGTEEVYFATAYLGVDGGIEVTASHNPKNYNGMKLVRTGSQPISCDTGLRDLQYLVEHNSFGSITKRRGSIYHINVLQEYINHLFSFVKINNFIHPITLVINSGNGAAGHVIDMIEARFQAAKLPITFIKIHHHPDGHFPNGIPNPSLLECRKDTIKAIHYSNANMGIAFDSDFDRCFLFDENSNFIEGYYMVGLLADIFLKKYPKNKIIHDPRLIWNTQAIVYRAGGIPIMSKSGHSFIKEKMRMENAIYGGEISAHHYFRNFFCCDSGMIPWLILAELISSKNQSLSTLINERKLAYPISGEVNHQSINRSSAIASVMNYYCSKALNIDYTDGISLTFVNWRFNLRCSNTEQLIRLNIESRGDNVLMMKKKHEILTILNGIY